MSGEDNPQDASDETTGQAQSGGQPQAQPAGQGAPAQGQPVQQGPSLVDKLQSPESMYWLKFNVALFAVFGVGYSVAFLLFNALLPGGGMGGQMVSAFLGFLVLLFGMFMAPLLATYTGVRIGKEFNEEQNLTLANSFVGSLVGFIVLFFVLFIIVLSIAGGGGGGGGGGGLGNLLAPVIGYGIGVGVTGLLATYVTQWLDGR